MHSLMATDRDVVRLRVGKSEEGSVKLNEGVSLIQGARDMLLATACSLGKSKAVYRAGANRKEADLMSKIRLGQTDQGNFVVTLLMPTIPRPVSSLLPDKLDQDTPAEQHLTARLIEALTALRVAAERMASGEEDAFSDATTSGVSANLCDALVKIIDSFPTLDVSVSWARIRLKIAPNQTFRFGTNDAPLLQQMAHAFREHAPRPDTQLQGYVRRLTREEGEENGIIHLNASIDGKQLSVTAFLERQDYEQAV